MNKYQLVINSVFSIMLFLCTPSYIKAQKVLEKDSLLVDFKQLVNYLTETHPEPFSAYGGKVLFYKTVFDIERQLSQTAYTKEQYTEIISQFLADLHDGHTMIYQSVNPHNSYLPINLRVFSDGLFISAIFNDKKEYLGSKLISINGVPVDDVCDKLTRFYPCENKYAAYTLLTQYNIVAWLKEIMPGISDRITLSLLTPQNETKDIAIPIVDYETANKMSAEGVERPGSTKEDYLYYKYVDKQVMYLKLLSVMGREPFQAMKQGGWDFEEQLKDFYRWPLEKDMPKDIDEAINSLPCYSGIFRNMLEEMKKQQTPYLVIDLRANQGGWTPMTLPTIYMLYGDEYLNKDMGTYFWRIISPLYMKKIAMTLEDFNRQNNTNYQYGDYTFAATEKDDRSIEEKRQSFTQNALGESKLHIADLNGKPVYTPKKIYVLINAHTFSAAFHYTFYLWKMGATVVGVPAMQAPNTFMEQTEFELPFTHLKGSISNSAQYFLPSNDPKATTFYPDMILKYEDYVRYNFHVNTELLWVLDKIKSGDKSE
jgi:hypothetical protein